ncbi:MAG TPA: peptide chain release factor N(5)-glutamine methyltransferase [Terriglobia bacterium]|nr:peptide chain release factor N(5)-glutamine methyltransferase [Terriglobia bacterium]
MVLREVLRNGAQRLMEGGIPASQFAAELLLMHTLGCDRTELHSHPEREISLNLAERYSTFISERLTGKPTQYITGHQEFWGLDFEVTPDVLIPRPETEGLVETVLDLVKRHDAARDAEPRIVDVGTGSGCIALVLASELPGAEIVAIDISPAALRVAKRNAARLGLAHRVKFRKDDLLTGFLAETERAFDFVVSNPPYVCAGELDQVQREVKEFEPRLAWGGLERGDEVYRRLFPQALRLLKPGGYVAVEIGYRQREAVVGLLGPEWTGIEVRPDLAGIARVVIARNAL